MFFSEEARCISIQPDRVGPGEEATVLSESDPVLDSASHWYYIDGIVKKLVSLALVVALLSPFSALALTYLTYDGALKMAKSENKPVLLYFYSNGCGYCRLMDKETLADKEIYSILSKNFVLLRVDIEKSTDLAMLYGIRGVPSSWFLEPSGKRIGQQIPGYVSKNDFKVLLEYVTGKHYKRMDMVDYFTKASRGK